MNIEQNINLTLYFTFYYNGESIIETRLHIPDEHNVWHQKYIIIEEKQILSVWDLMVSESCLNITHGKV